MLHFFYVTCKPAVAGWSKKVAGGFLSNVDVCVCEALANLPTKEVSVQIIDEAAATSYTRLHELVGE